MPSTEFSPSVYMPAERVITAMADWGRIRIDDLNSLKVLVLGVVGGAFIAAGALFSLLLGSVSNRRVHVFS